MMSAKQRLRICATTRRRWFDVWGVAAFALYGSSAAALDSYCPPDIGDVVVSGNLQIATPCELLGTEVRGDVTVFAGGSLIARDVRIRGDLSASRADFVHLERSRVDGDIRLEELVGDLSTIDRADIRGSLLLASNRSRLEILNNEIRRDLQATGNTGGLLISGNSIAGDLECVGNVPTPLGVANRVDGVSRGQCEALEAEPPAPGPPAPEPPAPGPPAPEPPPVSTPPPATDALEPELDDGGAGAIGWPAFLLLSLFVWRRFVRS